MLILLVSLVAGTTSRLLISDIPRRSCSGITGKVATQHGRSFNEAKERLQQEPLCAIHSHHSAVNMVNYMLPSLHKHKIFEQRQFVSSVSYQLAIEGATISSC